MSKVSTLLKLAKKGQYDNITEHVNQHQAILNEIDLKSGKGLIHFAIQSSDIELFELLIGQASINLEMPTKQGQNPLEIAVRLNNTFAVNRLLEAGVNFRNKTSSGQTVLHLAIKNQTDKDILKKLLNNRFDVNEPIQFFGSFLNLSIVQGYSDNFYFLMNDLPEINFTRAVDQQENTSLILAVQANKGDYVVCILTRLKEDKVLTNLDKQFFINHQNKEGNTAIHLAALKNYQTITQVLEKFGKQLGIDLSLSNKNGMTLLDIKKNQQRERAAEIQMQKRRQELKSFRKKEKIQEKVRQRQEDQRVRLQENRKRKEDEQRSKVEAKIQAQTHKKKTIWVLLIISVVILGAMYLAFVNTIEKNKPVTL